MLSILKMLSLYSGSRGPHWLDLPSSCGHKFHISLHTLPDDGRSISRNVAEKHSDSRHDKLNDIMNTTESTNTNIFKIKSTESYKVLSLVEESLWVGSTFALCA